MRNDEAVCELACTATRCLTANEFHREALDWIDRQVGIDGANLVVLDGGRVAIAETRGIDQAWRDRFAREIDGYRADLGSLIAGSIAQGGASWGDRSRLEWWASLPARQGFEEGMAFPLGFRVGSAIVLMLGGTTRGVLFLGRGGRTRLFTRDEGALLARIAPILALGSAIHERRAAPATPDRRGVLTARERDVVEFVTLGLGNREIGLALGVSPHTVRNQLAGIFDKLGVGSRAELVAVALREGLVDAPGTTCGSD